MKALLTLFTALVTISTVATSYAAPLTVNNYSFESITTSNGVNAGGGNLQNWYVAGANTYILNKVNLDVTIQVVWPERRVAEAEGRRKGSLRAGR